MGGDDILCRDSHGIEWSREQIQLLVNHAGSLTKVAARLGLTSGVRKLRDWGIQTPEEWFRGICSSGAEAVLAFLLKHGGLEGVASYTGLSERLVRRSLEEAGYSVGYPDPSAEEARAAMERFGSVELAARWCGTTTHRVKKVVPDWMDLRDLCRAGKTASSLGRVAELYYESMRGEVIVERSSGLRPQHPGYDYIDREWGRVNVKGAQGREGVWAWDVDPNCCADAFALVQLGRDCRPSGCVVVSKASLRQSEQLPFGLILSTKLDGMGLRTREMFPPRLEEEMRDGSRA